VHHRFTDLPRPRRRGFSLKFQIFRNFEAAL
jgi:hypothetical protein